MESSRATVAIVDFGLGNLYSVRKACEAVGLNARVTSVSAEVLAADGIILPGVGAFGDARRALEKLDLIAPLRDAAIGGRPLIGICLGMQLLLSESHEFGRHDGLGIIPGEVRRIEGARDAAGPLKVPHVGWNAIHQPIAGESWRGTPLAQTADGTPFYFVHSYYAVPENRRDVLALTGYGDFDFCSAVRRGNVVGFQFHPERSGPAGLAVYAQIADFVRRSVRLDEELHVA